MGAVGLPFGGGMGMRCAGLAGPSGRASATRSSRAQVRRDAAVAGREGEALLGVRRVGDTGRVQRYWVVPKTGATRVEEVAARPRKREGEESGGTRGWDDREENRIARLVLPRGYPRTVSPDYLEYAVWAFPTHVTGWIGATLVTSSLLKAVGFSDVGSLAGTSAAATAAIKWTLKDGLGGVGRLVASSRIGAVVDEDPRQWRMVGDVLVFLGASLECATPAFPHLFLPLAASGNIIRALSHALGHPAYGVILQHFSREAQVDEEDPLESSGGTPSVSGSRRSNLGEVYAKEHVQEQLAKFAGLGLGAASLASFGDSYQSVLTAWTAATLAHIALRYRALSGLVFDTLSYKRCAALCREFVAAVDAGVDLGAVRLSPPEVVCREEPLLKVAALFPGFVRFSADVSVLQDSPDLLVLYAGEQYVLERDGDSFHVVLKHGSSELDLVRSMLQAAFLERRERAEVTAAMANPKDLLEASLGDARNAYAFLVDALQRAGWDARNSSVRFAAEQLRQAAGDLEI